MADVTLNGMPVQDGDLRVHRVGMWSSHSLVAADQITNGPATLQIGSYTFNGFAIRTSQYFGRAPTFIAGTATGGLLKTVNKKSYSLGISLGVLVDDLILEMGEQLAQPLDAAISSINIPSWTRRAGPAEQALTLLLQSANAVWRTDPSGKILVTATPPATQPWPDSTAEVYLLDSRPDLSMDIYALDEPTIVPGTVLNGRRVSEVCYKWTDDAFRAEVQWEDGPDVGETQMRAAFFDLVRQAIPNYPYLRWCSATVRGLAPNGYTVHFDDPDLDDQNVRIFPPSPGGKITAQVNDKLLVAFVQGDLSRPIGALFDTDGSQAQPVAIVGSDVDGGTLVITMGMGSVAAIVWYPPNTPPAAILPPANPPAVVHISLSGKITSGAKGLGAV